MTKDEIKAAVLRALLEIAPEADAADIKPNVPLREQLDIDSFDFLNVLVRLHEALGVEIPETDYAKVATLDGFVSYLAAKKAAA